MTVMDLSSSGSHPTEIVSGDVSGGPNTSHTILLPSLATLLNSVPLDADQADYERAVLEDNVLAKDTGDGRRRTLRYLKELYLLRPDSLLFRSLRDLWPDDPDARPLLAMLCAMARDPVLRASSSEIIAASPGQAVGAGTLASAVQERFPGSYNPSTLAKIGRNTFSSWEQSGHLKRSLPGAKERTRAAHRPANLAYALLLGHLEGVRGANLFETQWASMLDAPHSHLVDLAAVASQRGLLEFRNAGGIVEVGFRVLLRPIEGALL